MSLMRDGGLPMWFIVAFGLTALASSVGYAIRPDDKRRSLTRGMSLATLFATLAAVAAALGATLNTLARRRSAEIRIDLPDGAVNLLTGFAESMSPLIMGFALLALTAMFSAVGGFREAAARSGN
jgi:hypothetical protein